MDIEKNKKIFIREIKKIGYKKNKYDEWIFMFDDGTIHRWSINKKFANRHYKTITDNKWIKAHKKPLYFENFYVGTNGRLCFDQKRKFETK